MSRNRGFTLIELMIAMVIIAVVAAIAIPAYTKSAMKGRRADAKESLVKISQALERCYSQYGLYTSGNCTPYVDSSATFVGQNSDKGYYTIAASGTDFSGTAYKLTATAVSSGPQASDTGCTIMSLSSAGAQTSGGNSTDTGSCWN